MGMTTCTYCEKYFPSEDCKDGVCAECASWERCLNSMKRLREKNAALRARLAAAEELLAESSDLIRRGIECGCGHTPTYTCLACKHRTKIFAALSPQLEKRNA